MKVHTLAVKSVSLLAGMLLAAGATGAVCPTQPTATHFSAGSDGQIRDPSNYVWRGAGIGVVDDYIYGRFNYTGGTALAAQILDVFPNMNLLRLACYTGNDCYEHNDPTEYAAFVNEFTSRDIVVVIEHHDANHTVLTGADLTKESLWYATLACYYINEPYVWFQTMNEPAEDDADQQVATYHAIRDQGNNALIFFEAGDWAGGDHTTLGDTSGFDQLHDIGWDLHSYYNHEDVYYTDVLNDQNERIDNLQDIESADGIMPVISLEGGNAFSPTGAIDPDEDARLDITFTNPNLVGYAAWSWNIYASCSKADNLLNYDLVNSPSGPRGFTTYGLRVANYISMRGGNVSQPGATIPGASYLIDPAYNVWTVSGGVISINGVPDTNTHDVELLLYLNGGIYQQANGGGWWSYGNGQWYVNTGDPRSSSYPAANASIVIAGSGRSLRDAQQNTWTTGWKNGSNWVICKNEAVDAGTANVTRLLFYNGVLYQEASSGGWWSYVNGAWNTLGGDPRPAPSTSGATIPSATQLSDAARNIWTVSGGVIYQNGAQEVGTQNVTLLLYYNGFIYQEANGGGWWKYENGGWTTIGGDPR